MRAAALYSAAGSLLLTALAAAPAGSTPAVPGALVAQGVAVAPGTAAAPGTAVAPAAAEQRGTAMAAARARAAGIDFGTCAGKDMPGTMKCGTVSVPLDYAHPGGKQIRLTVTRVRATQKDPHNSKRRVRRQGALVYNPGGPGGSGMYFPLVGALPEWKGLAAAYDLVGYAPRGVGRSAPLSCTDPKHYLKAPTQTPTHPSQSYKKERVAQAKSYAQGCARRSGSGLRYFNSLNNARDLDVLRAALGDARINLLGFSCGTFLGQVVANTFPGRTGAHRPERSRAHFLKLSATGKAQCRRPRYGAPSLAGSTPPERPDRSCRIA
jgi:pimeloyl-ACP methyl ester carboxylesterase